MRTLTDQLANYAAYHRDRRNIITHFIGIPMIVLAVTILLARPSFDVGLLIPLTPAVILFVLTSLFYLRLEFALGLAMVVQTALYTWLGHWFGEQSTVLWLVSGIGLFALGWVIQFVGHFYEGRKPAFVDDVVGLLIGPLFITAELLFALGLRKPLLAEIEKRVGPTHDGSAARAAG